MQKQPQINIKMIIWLLSESNYLVKADWKKYCLLVSIHYEGNVNVDGFNISSTNFEKAFGVNSAIAGCQWTYFQST